MRKTVYFPHDLFIIKTNEGQKITVKATGEELEKAYRDGLIQEYNLVSAAVFKYMNLKPNWK